MQGTKEGIYNKICNRAQGWRGQGLAETKVKRIHVKVTEAEKQMLQEIAGRVGMNASEWIRFMIYKNRVKKK